MSERSEWSDDELEDYEYPEVDDSDDDELATVECPECGREVYEELQQCPHCGEYITHRTTVWAGKPWWWIALAVIGIVAVLAALLAIY